MGAPLNVLVLANPIAGAGAGRTRAEALAGLLRARGHEVECFLSDGPDAIAERLALPDALAGVELLVAVGGDGTLSDLVNSLPVAAAVPLAQLAVGTANMLARELGLPRTPEGVADLVERGRVRRIDLGRAGERRFVMNASVGYDAMVVEAIARGRRGTLSFRAYARPMLDVLTRYREPELQVRVEDDAAIPAGIAIVSNLRNYGGLFTVAHAAAPDDGLLDVVAGPARKRDLVGYLAAGLGSGMTRSDSVLFRQARRVRIDSAEPVPVQLDGDLRGTTPVEIEVEPGAIAILAPAPARPRPA